MTEPTGYGESPDTTDGPARAPEPDQDDAVGTPLTTDAEAQQDDAVQRPGNTSD